MNLTSRKPLGFWTLTSLVVGNMVGSGIFLLPANLAKFGGASMWAWLITALGAFFLAVILSRSSQIVRSNGGPYAFVRAGLGNFMGFQTVYNHWVAMWVANLALILALITYMSRMFPILLNPVIGIIFGIIIIWLLTLVNIKGVGTAGKLQLVTTILKVLPILLLIVVGIWYIKLEHLSFMMKGSSGLHGASYQSISAAAGMTLWAFIGLESATVPYNFVENPQRNVPLATIIGVLFATAIYIIGTTIVMGVLPPDVLAGSSSPYITAAELIFGAWGKWLMIVGAIISCFGCINGWTLVLGQVTMAAADHDLFPTIFGQRNKMGVPAVGLIITAILESIILLLTLNKDMLEQFNLIVLMASLAALIPYLYATFASLVLMKRPPYGFKFGDKLLVLIASLAAVYAFWVISIAGEKIIFYGSILVFTSALLYGWGYGNAPREPEVIKQDEVEEE